MSLGKTAGFQPDKIDTAGQITPFDFQIIIPRRLPFIYQLLHLPPLNIVHYQVHPALIRYAVS